MKCAVVFNNFYASTPDAIASWHVVRPAAGPRRDGKLRHAVHHVYGIIANQTALLPAFFIEWLPGQPISQRSSVRSEYEGSFEDSFLPSWLRLRVALAPTPLT